MRIQLRGSSGLFAVWILVAAMAIEWFGAAALAADKEKPGDEAAAGATVFQPNKVWQVEIIQSTEEYDAMQPRGGRGFGFFGGRTPEAQTAVDLNREVHRNNFGMDLPWATGKVVIGDNAFEKVGIRYKGNGTIGDASRTIKKSIKIDLDRAGGTDKFGGSKTINLHCGVTDPSKCRETLGYELYRAAGVPASRTTLAEVRLTVPGKYEKELLGVYTLVEEVDNAFLRDRFGSDQGLLMKPEGMRDFDTIGNNWERYKQSLAMKREATPQEAERMIAFARLIQTADDATFQKEIGSYLDVDGYLRFLAATAFVANSDSYFVLGHNFYAYLHPETKKLHFIPWDLDRAFANFPILGSNAQQMDLSLRQPYPGAHRLTDRLLAAPGMREQYQKIWKELSTTVFDKDRLLTRLAECESAIKDLRERDAQAAANRKEGPGGFGPPGMFGKPPELTMFFEKRVESVLKQLAGTSKGHIPTSGFGRGGPPPIGPMMAGQIMEAFDADANKKLSRSEWLAIADKVFAACKKDSSGGVDLESLTAGLTGLLPTPPDGAPRGPFNPAEFLSGPILARGDANKDKKVSSEELLAAAAALFDEFDRPKGGQVDEEKLGEMLGSLFPAQPFGGPRGGPPGGGRGGFRGRPGGPPGGFPGPPGGRPGDEPEGPFRRPFDGPPGERN